MTAARNMQIPVPGAAHKRRLRIERIIPAADNELQPAFGVDRNVNGPGAPGMEVFFREQLIRGFVPYAAAVGADFDALGPVAARSAGESPAAHGDGAGVDDDAFVEGVDDCGGDGHALDGEAGGVGHVVFADLGREVEVLFLLHRGPSRLRYYIDAREPFDRSVISLARSAAIVILII